MGSRFAQWLLMLLLSQTHAYRVRRRTHTLTPHVKIHPCDASGASCPEPQCSSGDPVKMHVLFHLIEGGQLSAFQYCGLDSVPVVQLNPLMHWTVALGKTHGCDAKSIFDDNAVIIQNCNSGPRDWWAGIMNRDFYERTAYKVCKQSWTSYLAWFPPLAQSVHDELLGWRHVGWMCARNESEAADYIVDRIAGELDLKTMPHKRQEDFGADENNTMMYSETAHYAPLGSYVGLRERAEL
eukprot:TRINITY_DN7496_c0_g1_i1.p1 TRINITY_DN7496_c0_g1~~TRINITY_DN7496_c0_g1_i1.p1  ORF type:complete len:265 (-),score=14.45 TRINITY_DN7496_c0_g1_i1:248-964(-)